MEYYFHDMAAGTSLVSTENATILVSTGVEYQYDREYRDYRLTLQGYARLLAARDQASEHGET